MIAAPHPPRRIPQSFRFQIYSVVDVTCNACGVESPRISRLVWEELPGSELGKEISTRVRMARDRAQSLADHDQVPYALGIKSVFDDSPFQMDTIIRCSLPNLDTRDRLLLTAGNGVPS